MFWVNSNENIFLPYGRKVKNTCAQNHDHFILNNLVFGKLCQSPTRFACRDNARCQMSTALLLDNNVPVVHNFKTSQFNYFLYIYQCCSETRDGTLWIHAYVNNRLQEIFKLILHHLLPNIRSKTSNKFCSFLKRDRLLGNKGLKILLLQFFTA